MRTPDWGGHAARPGAPTARSIAYVQGGPPELIYYATQNVAVIPAAGGTAKVLTPGSIVR